MRGLPTSADLRPGAARGRAAPTGRAGHRGSWQAQPGDTRGRFEGADHGSPLSAFIVDAATGEGPALHWHSYVETFIVLSGHARFRRGDDFLDAGSGDVVVVPSGTLHRFESVGPERLRLIAVHDSPRLESNFV